MKIAIDKSILGTNNHLICEDETYSWSSSLPEDVWSFGDLAHPKSLDEAARLFRHELTFPEKRYQEMYSFLSSPKSIPWQRCLPHDIFQKCLSDLLRDISVILKSLNDTNYGPTFSRAQKTILSLSAARIDQKKLQYYLVKDGLPALRTFLSKDDYLSPPTYQRSPSTGRLVVRQGPQILTLRKDHREIIRSRFEGGKIFLLDYVSLEPRVTLALANREVPNDIYASLSEKFNLNLSRKDLKIAIMGALYGISSGRLREVLSDNGNAVQILSEIKRYFGVYQLSNMLTSCYQEYKRILNYYGRPIAPDNDSSHILVSYYIQSSGADIALLGFSNIIDLINLRGWKMCPIYILHDALFIDVPPDEFAHVRSLEEAGAKIPGFDVKFPLKSETL